MSSMICNASWDGIQALHDFLGNMRDAKTVGDVAQRFVERLVADFSSLALARMFVVVPLGDLPPEEQELANQLAQTLGRPTPVSLRTPTLCLLGTMGKEPEWQRRERSRGHRAIPLLDRQLVDGAPMIAALLSSMQVDLEKLQGDEAVQLRSLVGGFNARFYVRDARSSVDAQNRHIIASQDFVAKYAIRTVFGMGGAYKNGAHAVAILFTRELLEPLHVDRFPSLIGSFKLATAPLVEAGALI
jgi:hypothetical protein